MSRKYAMPIDSVTALIRSGTESLTINLEECSDALKTSLTARPAELKAQIKSSTGHDVVITKKRAGIYIIRRSKAKGAS